MKDMEAQTKFKALASFQKQNNLPLTLKFEDVECKIKTTKGGVFNKNTENEEKVILKGVSGIVEPGEMLAMLGPSGSGKTTLLNALGGRLRSNTKVQGTITYNNEPFSNTTNRDMGFVTQDDILYPHLTVTETLVFTALLRLPNTLTKKEKVSCAETMITQLGLTECKDSIIGGPLVRGVSGGERKRVSIGQEMLVNPRLLFLDEPTSGLDSTMAQSIVSTLWELANAGRTVVMTIHQPSSRLYYMFFKVLLLSEGSPLFFGKGSDAMHYFLSLGYAPTLGMNPSDFLLDLANGIYTDESGEDHASLKQTLVLAYRHNLEAQVKEMVCAASDIGKIEGRFQGRELDGWSTTWFQQFSVLLKRGVKERRYESFSGLKVTQIVMAAIISGVLWFKSDVSHLQDQIGLLFFIGSFWSFFPFFQAICTFPQERTMLEKERSSGTYRLSSYFISRTVADLPMELVLPTVFLIICYWMVGLKHHALNFLYTLFTLLLSVLVSQGLGFALGAIVMDQSSVTTLGSVVMLTSILAGGYYVQHVPKFIAWIKYLSINYYTYQLFVGSQYESKDTYPCSEGQCLVAEFPSIKQIGLHVKDQVIAALALVIMLIGFRLIAYLALMRIGVTKKLV
ncbi:hypothetical protein K1719_027205 [Acacia pycnantha]|nr:hypothetical protein K1719_027205 [Acacia pycnantha]